MFLSLLSLLSASSLTALVVARSAPLYHLEHAELHFENFIKEYNRQYADGNEKHARLQIFKNNLEIVNQLNEQTHETVFGITKFMDITPEEFAEKYTNLKMPSFDDIKGCASLTDADVPDDDGQSDFVLYDWRGEDDIPGSRDQGQCLANYAFVTTDVISIRYGFKYAKKTLLSQQQIIDCTAPNGCSGGNMLSAYRAIIDMGGIETEDDYPYIEDESKECRLNKSRVKAKVSSCQSYNLVDQDKVRILLYRSGPLAIAIRGANLQFYKFGPFSDKFCTGEINHALLLVGWGFYGAYSTGNQTWVAQNYWGSDWGSDGSVILERGDATSSCGMLNPLMSAVIIA